MPLNKYNINLVPVWHVPDNLKNNLAANANIF